MTSKLSRTALAAAMALAALSGSGCGGGDSNCVAAKKHMCERIPDMNCYAAFMDSAQQKIVDACGQAELDAYIPVVQQACQDSQTTGVPMSCDAVAGPTYTAVSDGGGLTCDGGAPMQFSYSGAATADGRPSTLEFTVSGNSVMNGKLHADSVCSTTVHLNRTDLTFSGTLAGTWESATGTITASWSGGDFACDGTQLTPAAGYPTSGSLTITLSGTSVVLQRTISGALPYEFAASGHVYVPPTQTACTASGHGGAGGSIDGGRGGSGGSRDASVTADAGHADAPIADAGRDVTGGAPTFGSAAASYKGTGTYKITLSSSAGSASCTAPVNITGTVNVTAPGWVEITFTHPTFTFSGEQSCTQSTTETSDEDFYATSHDTNGNFVMNAWIAGRYDDATMTGTGTSTSTMGTVVVETIVNTITFSLSRVN